MSGLLRFTRYVDAINDRFAIIAAYLVLLACLVSAGNAAIRYAFDRGSNAWLEIAVVHVCRHGDVRCSQSACASTNTSGLTSSTAGVSSRTKAMIDLFGLVVFLLPMTLLMIYCVWPFVIDSYVSKEMSSNAGGLIRWPFKVILPFGFALLAVQGVAEIIKRIAYLRGRIANGYALREASAMNDGGDGPVDVRRASLR